ncbi:hypothetical protein [Saccharothrix texasensis]|nr:hypothetical protein [Saccharothrix texasensis]
MALVQIIATSSGRVRQAFVAGAAVLMLASCSQQDTNPPMSSAGPTSPSASLAAPQSPADQARLHALAAYQGMWEDFVEAAATSDWRSPKLGRYATGLALSTLSRGLYADHYNGLVSKGTPTHNAQVSSVEPAADPAQVIISDCSDSTNALKYRADSGQPADDGAGGRRLIKATVEKQSDGSWKVSDFGVQGVGTC